MKSVSLRIDEVMLKKIQIVAKHEGRSTNGQINILIRDALEKFEKQHKNALNTEK
ncbi:MAG: Arc family DNA-binding protein [Clostridia bacterium]|nr:Arc family DNA-binding protein [Clostridia bacterium]